MDELDARLAARNAQHATITQPGQPQNATAKALEPLEPLAPSLLDATPILNHALRAAQQRKERLARHHAEDTAGPQDSQELLDVWSSCISSNGEPCGYVPVLLFDQFLEEIGIEYGQAQAVYLEHIHQQRTHAATAVEQLMACQQQHAELQGQVDEEKRQRRVVQAQLAGRQVAAQAHAAAVEHHQDLATKGELPRVARTEADVADLLFELQGLEDKLKEAQEDLEEANNDSFARFKRVVQDNEVLRQRLRELQQQAEVGAETAQEAAALELALRAQLQEQQTKSGKEHMLLKAAEACVAQLEEELAACHAATAGVAAKHKPAATATRGTLAPGGVRDADGDGHLLATFVQLPPARSVLAHDLDGPVQQLVAAAQPLVANALGLSKRKRRKERRRLAREGHVAAGLPLDAVDAKQQRR
ncbi:hypothetical protein D9Q98_006301 [Chlorella vulgaris]|uniref:Uncharacterized protein n=1 Tax=Chlorella vulgaris TaxID=3077 RepID=A0A9D4TXE2_CHLVU|nr:hypothetical protein D9Q98_006301 [Chlorella vulgaris]